MQPVEEKDTSKPDTSLIDNTDTDNNDNFPYPARFAGIQLSQAAAQSLHKAGFLQHPTAIQAAAIPALMSGESLLF